jgi:hypothetical protein
MRCLIEVAAVLVLVGCVNAEDMETHYQNIAAARRDGAFDRGWLPAFVPPDATNIWELHNVSSNITWSCFSTPSGVEAVRAALLKEGGKRAEGPIADGPTRFFLTRSWWPPSMSRVGVEAYQLREDQRFGLRIGLDERSRTVCFHRCSVQAACLSV